MCFCRKFYILTDPLDMSLTIVKMVRWVRIKTDKFEHKVDLRAGGWHRACMFLKIFHSMGLTHKNVEEKHIFFK